MKVDYPKAPSTQLRQVVYQALDLVETNLTEPIDAGHLILSLEVSYRYFQRLFKSIVGLSFGQYFRLRRLSDAARRLHESKTRVIDIAFNYNFKSQEAFTRAFKQFSGLTPAEFRKNRDYVLTEYRKPLTAECIQTYWDQVQRTPQIRSLHNKLLVGKSVEFKSHFVEGSDCAIKVVDHWKKNWRALKAVPGHTIDKYYGVALSEEKALREQYLKYYAGVEITSAENVKNWSLKPKFDLFQIPKGTYAVFEKVGLAEQHSSLIDYIYGIWLPSSEYIRREAYDFEEFDQRYQLGNPNSISYYYVPVTKIE